MEAQCKTVSRKAAFSDGLGNAKVERMNVQCRRQKGKEVGSTLVFVTTLFSLMSLLSYSAAQSELCFDLFLWDRMGI